jgi:hypothetical protein
MRTVRALAAALMSKGVITPGWYSILTGAAMLYVALALRGATDTDPAAPVVAAVLGATGVWLLVRGIRSELRRKGTG